MEREESGMGKTNWMLIAACLVAAFVGGAVSNWALSSQAAFGQGKAQVLSEVRARSFFVVDERGKLCAVLTGKGSGPGLSLYDEDGMGRADLTITEMGPSLTLYDENGKPRTALAVIRVGPTLGLWDEKGKIIWHAP